MYCFIRKRARDGDGIGYQLECVAADESRPWRAVQLIIVSDRSSFCLIECARRRMKAINLTWPSSSSSIERPKACVKLDTKMVFFFFFSFRLICPTSEPLLSASSVTVTLTDKGGNGWLIMSSESGTFWR